jgi:hypothetical protein
MQVMTGTTSRIPTAQAATDSRHVSAPATAAVGVSSEKVRKEATYRQVLH